MKKLFILAISAILVANVSAQEQQAGKAECKKAKKECKMSKEERIEMEIKMLSDELYLSDEQAAKFAVTYREYMAEQAKLKEQFKVKFSKDLNEKQVKRVLNHQCMKKGPHPDFGQFPPKEGFPPQGPHPGCPHQ
jgi:hypothetical protein